jgi:hypothetical protein
MATTSTNFAHGDLPDYHHDPLCMQRREAAPTWRGAVDAFMDTTYLPSSFDALNLHDSLHLKKHERLECLLTSVAWIDAGIFAHCAGQPTCRRDAAAAGGARKDDAKMSKVDGCV